MAQSNTAAVHSVGQATPTRPAEHCTLASRQMALVLLSLGYLEGFIFGRVATSFD